MKDKKNVAWFQLCPSKETIPPLVLGSLAILFSVLMNYTESQGWRLFLRSICQMGIVGVILPLLILSHKGELYQSGIKWEKPVKMLLISIILGALLSIVFIKESGGHINNLFAPEYIQATVYVMIANIFEVIFFFAFMRYYLEKAFGVVVAILLTSLFYSFHHAGFEPSFVELFIVGVVFISIFRIANNILICFPLWWVGGLGDVLVSKNGMIDNKRMSFVGILPVVICFVIAIVVILFIRYWKKGKKRV